jgi:DNA-binding PucR family transcriptional regulator
MGDEQQDTELRLIADAQRTLTRAASRLRPLEGTLRALGATLNCWTMLLDAEDAVVAKSGPAPEPDDELRKLAATRRSSSGKPSTSGTVGDTQVVSHAIEPVATRPNVLLVGRTTEFSRTERAVIAMAVALLGLLRRDVDVSRGFAARLAARLLLTGGGAAAESTGELLAQLLDNRASQHYRVLSGVDTRQRAHVNVGGDFDRLVQLLGTPLVDVTPDGFRAIVAARSAPSEATLHTLQRRGWLVGMSGSATISELRAAEREAVALRRQASANGKPMRAEDGTNSVTSLVDPIAARAFARRRLSPLATIRSPGGAQLVETLRVWLANHGDWDRAAEVLGMHRTSVRHRIQQVEQVLGNDLSDAQQRMDLWYAINWLPPDWPNEE